MCLSSWKLYLDKKNLGSALAHLEPKLELFEVWEFGSWCHWQWWWSFGRLSPIYVLFAFKIFLLPVPTRPVTRTFLQVPDPSSPEVNPYPSGPGWGALWVYAGGHFGKTYYPVSHIVESFPRHSWKSCQPLFERKLDVSSKWQSHKVDSPLVHNHDQPFHVFQFIKSQTLGKIFPTGIALNITMTRFQLMVPVPAQKSPIFKVVIEVRRSVLKNFQREKFSGLVPTESLS